MQINVRTQYINERAELGFGQYVDGAIGITMFSLEGEPLAKATVCLEDYGYTPPGNCVVIKNYSENEGMLDLLVAEGVIEKPCDFFSGPYGDFPICELTAAATAAAIEAGAPADMFTRDQPTA